MSAGAIARLLVYLQKHLLDFFETLSQAYSVDVYGMRKLDAKNR
ncbi:hypothetical protein GGR92_002583 [Spirosoma lacussanchae]